MTRFVGSVLVLLAASIAMAGDVVTINGSQFIRSQVWTGSRYCYQYSAYTPPAYAAPAYVAPATPYVAPTPEDPIIALIGLAAARDKAVLAERAKFVQYQGFASAVKVLGLDGNFRVEGYGPNMAYGTNFAQSYQTYSQAQPFFAPQASTVYGYSSQANFYGEFDINAAVQSYARTVQQSQTAGSQAVTELGSVLDQELGRRTKILEALAKEREIRAKGDAFAAAMKALEEKKLTITQSGTTTVPNPPQVVPLPVAPATQPAANPGAIPAGDTLAQLGDLFEAKCSACHNQTTKKGGLDLSAWISFDQPKKTSIVQRVVSNDQEKWMPRDAKTGGPGQHLTAEEVKLLLSN